MAVARDMSKKDHKVIAITGDGSLTGGLSYEGLNQAGALGKDLLIILNDNTMSISKNVGAISKYLTDIITDESYNKLKAEIWNLTGMMPKKDSIRRGIASIQDMIKGFLVPGQVFEKLGFRADLGTTPYPEYTKTFLYSVPIVLTLWPAFLLAVNNATKREDESEEGEV